MLPRFGMPAHLRVKSEKDFRRAYRLGSRARGAVLVVVAVDNGLGFTRLGLSVGRKIWRSAVKRNRVRRIFREAFRLTRERLPEGYDLILIAAESRLDPTLQATERELVHLAAKAARRYRKKVASTEPEEAAENPAGVDGVES